MGVCFFGGRNDVRERDPDFHAAIELWKTHAPVLSIDCSAAN
jgi:hypothetical protein